MAHIACLYGGGRMRNIRKEWDDTASAYERFNNSPDSYSYNIEWPYIQKMLPELKGKRILDLGCGTGIFSFLLETYGPEKIIGVDLSGEMLRIAEEKAGEKRSKAVFVSGDAARIGEYFQEPFDFIFSSTTTHYIENLEMLFGNVERCLKHGGVGIFSVIHPVYSAQYPIEHGDAFPTDDEWNVRYLDKRMRAYVQPWIEFSSDFENHLSTSYHHTFGDYVNAILGSGLTLQEIGEPLPPETWQKEDFERYDSFVETPTYMIIKIAKL